MYSDERLDEHVLQLLGHVEIMEKDKIAKTMYVGKFVGRGGMTP